jgi:L-ascorbate metabolism protein UlaG (beta-lactamase superfamily)
MKARVMAGFCLVIGLAGWLAHLHGQETKLSIQRVPNKEIALSLNAPTGLSYRIDAATGFPAWTPLVTLPASSATSLQHTDSAAPFLNSRYYRAEQLSGTNIFTGDHLGTTNGDVIFHPIGHATVVMNWNGKTIYADPTNGPAAYASLPRADLILVTHSHGDHFSSSTIDAVRGSNAIIVAPLNVYTNLSVAQKAITSVLGYGTSTNVIGLTVEAVAAYNSYHAPAGFGNGYVLTIGGKRIYISGDTGNVPEIHLLQNIDVAFVCMNQPYTMTITDATNAVSAFHPKVVYPYHFRDQSGTITNAAVFKQRLDPALAVEVRLRKWY